MNKINQKKHGISFEEAFPLATALTLQDIHTQTSLTLPNVTLSLNKQNNQLIECRLTFPVTFELYQRIETDNLFNLTPEVKNSTSSEKFISELNIIIETSLKPDLLSYLDGHNTTIEETANYLLNLSQEQPETPLLSTQSWLALSVKQQQESTEIGYQTLWSYISPESLTNAATSTEAISQSIINFFQDWAETTLSARTEKSTSEMLESVSKLLTELDELNFDEIAQKIEEKNQTFSNNSEIFQEVVNFFIQENWNFIKLEEETVLQMMFQGKNGTWNCYARTRDEHEQFIFYSICPVNTPENKRQSLAEFITRINLGIVIGNFELDLNDGEIRYKTSIDVEGDELSFKLIKQLVYANVMMMDQYLSGIMAVMYGNLSPEEAIMQIEN